MHGRCRAPSGRRGIGKGPDSETRVPKTPTTSAKQEFEGKPDQAADCDDWMLPLTLSEGIRFPMPAQKSLITVPETDGGTLEA